MEEPKSTDLYTVGTTATILRYLTTPDGTHNLVVQGDQRFRVAQFLEDRPHKAARVELLPDPAPVNRDIDARRLQVKARASELGEQIAKARRPEEVEKPARKDLSRLSQMSEQSPESSMVRTYLDWLVELPWALPKEEPIAIDEARRILDDDHYGLAKVKRRILEYLAVRKLNPEGKSPILCFVGPPGVGKTSLGQSIARAL